MALLCRSYDGMDRPALPVLPSAADAPGAALHRNADHRARCCTATGRGFCDSMRPNIRWRCNLAGREPAALAACARIGADLGFDEINLNAGCPSDRVQDGRFGACLMAEPQLRRRLRRRHESGGRHSHYRQMPHRHRRAGSRTRRLKSSPKPSNEPEPTRSSCMRAKPGSKACRRRKTAKFRRWITTASTG